MAFRMAASRTAGDHTKDHPVDQQSVLFLSLWTGQGQSGHSETALYPDAGYFEAEGRQTVVRPDAQRSAMRLGDFRADEKPEAQAFL